MTKKGKNRLICVIACSLIVLFVIKAASFALQESKVDPELLDELVGNYKFEIQGQAGAFIFIEEEGKLKGAPAGEEPSGLVPKEGEEMTFVGYSSDGTEHLFKFLRDDDGKVAKCVLSIPAAGLVVDMFKMEE